MKKVDEHGFYIAGRSVRWGTTLLELKSLLSTETHIKSNSQNPYPTVHIECEDAYGFAATEFEADAPEFGLPVQRVRYKLAPPYKHYEFPDPKFWLSKLTESLGNPIKAYKNRPANMQSPSDSVVHSAKWQLGAVEVSLSVWGGVRQSSAGRLSAAGLYIDWEDVVQAAEPTIDRNVVMEQKLERYAAEATNVDVFDLIEKQEPYFRRAGTTYPFKPPADEQVRKAQRALYRSELMDTPSAIKDYLDDNEVAVWQIKEGDLFVVSTKWDSVVVDPTSHNRINWENILPAKGGGRMLFAIGHLAVRDKTRSKRLTALVERIQMLLPQPIKCHESYDC